jgi:hypothetical protein
MFVHVWYFESNLRNEVSGWKRSRIQTYVHPGVETLAIHTIKVGLGMEDDLVQLPGLEHAPCVPHLVCLALGPELHASAVGVGDPADVCHHHVSAVCGVLIPLR